MKKGYDVEAIEFVIIGIVLMIVLGAYALFLEILLEPSPSYAQVKSGTLTHKITHDPNGIIYTNQRTGRSYPGIIDTRKWSQERMDKAIRYESPQSPAALIRNQDIEIYVGKKHYLTLAPLDAESVNSALLSRLHFSTTMTDGEKQSRTIFSVNAVAPR